MSNVPQTFPELSDVLVGFRQVMLTELVKPTRRFGNVEPRLNRIDGRLDHIGDSIMNLEGHLFRWSSDHVYSVEDPKALSLIAKGIS